MTEHGEEPLSYEEGGASDPGRVATSGLPASVFPGPSDPSFPSPLPFFPWVGHPGGMLVVLSNFV